ncbi:MAG TPA: hypothetical protein VFP34_15955 [Microlunatus sp.]|nr:hypothetical protein [Microlunatus sp.]
MSRARVVRWPVAVSVAVLIAVGLLSSRPAPASASVPDRQMVYAESATNSSDKGVTVTCPEGTQRLASGADVGGVGGAYVVVDDLVPGPRSVTAFGYEYHYGTSLTWFIRAWAVCGSLNTTVYTYAHTSGYDTSVNKSVSVDCGSDEVVLGTGYQLSGARGDALVTALTPSRNTVTVEASAVDLSSTMGGWSVTAFAICATDPGGRSQISDTTSSDSGYSRLGHATCPSGMEAFGAGFALNGFRGRLNIRDIYPTDDGTAFSEAEELVSTTDVWSLTTYVVCAAA